MKRTTKKTEPPEIPREFYKTDEDYALKKLSVGLCLKYAAMFNQNKAPKKITQYFEDLQKYESEKRKNK